MAEYYRLKSKFDSAENCLEDVALYDTCNYNYVVCYAFFLQGQNKHEKAVFWYKVALNHINNESQKGDILSKLAIIQQARNEYTLAVSNINEAITIKRSLARENPKIYLPDLARDLNNFGLIQEAKSKRSCL